MECPPELVLFVVDRTEEGGLLRSTGHTETETRLVMVDYLDNRNNQGSELWLQGIATLKNLRDQNAVIKYRQSVPIDQWLVARPPVDSPVCIEFGNAVVYWEQRVDEKSEIDLDISWSVELFDRADLNEDGIVDSTDLGLLLQGWGNTNTKADINQDGVVDGVDLGRLFERWSE